MGLSLSGAFETMVLLIFVSTSVRWSHYLFFFLVLPNSELLSTPCVVVCVCADCELKRLAWRRRGVFILMPNFLLAFGGPRPNWHPVLYASSVLCTLVAPYFCKFSSENLRLNSESVRWELDSEHALRVTSTPHLGVYWFIMKIFSFVPCENNVFSYLIR